MTLEIKKGTALGVSAAAKAQGQQTQKPAYSIDYEDQRFKDIEAQKQEALDKYGDRYDQMISNSDKFYQSQIDATKQYEETQTKLQQEQTELELQQIEQQKEQAEKDYTREQQGAYTDWQKQIDQYGATAEQMAAQGLQGTGYSESSQVAMFNTYQNRVATAREAFAKANLNYDNAMQEARLAGSVALAEIAFNSYKSQLEIMLQGFQYENDLLKEQMNMELQLDETFHNRWQDVVEQMNHENAMAEEIRQFNQQMKMEQYQLNIQRQQWEKDYSFQKQQYEESIRQFEEEMKRLKENDAKEYKLEIEKLEMQKEQLEEEKKQWEKQMAEEKRQFNKTYELQKKNLTSSSSGGSSKSSSSSGSGKTINKDSSSGSSGSNGPTSAQIKSYNTFQTNIANLMIKNPSESSIENMENQLKEAAKNGKITEAQYVELLNLLN